MDWIYELYVIFIEGEKQSQSVETENIFNNSYFQVKFYEIRRGKSQIASGSTRLGFKNQLYS